jgi:hypothetical protein
MRSFPAAVALMLTLASSAMAETPDERIARLEARVKTLEAQLVAAKITPATAPAPATIAATTKPMTIEAIMATMPADLDPAKPDPNGIRAGEREKWIGEHLRGVVVSSSGTFDWYDANPPRVKVIVPKIKGIGENVFLITGVGSDTVSSIINTTKGSRVDVVGKISSVSVSEGMINLEGGSVRPKK